MGTSPWLYKPGMPSQKFIYPSKLLICLILMLSNGHELSLIYSIHKKNIFDFALRTLKYFEIFEVHTFLIELEMID